VPEIDGKGQVRASQDCDEVALEGLYRPFCLVRSFCKRWYEFEFDVLRYEVLPQAFRCFVVRDLDLTKCPSWENHW
jgi:hypothetical protein